MIAYESDGQPILDLHTRPINQGDLRIADTFVDVVSAYNLALTPQIHPDGMGQSDHASFWQVGYPAILAIEDGDDFTPYYHTVDDTLETLNLDYFTDFVKASLGTLSHMGCMLGTVSGVVQDVDSGLPLSGVRVEALENGLVMKSTTSTLSGDYTLDLVLGSYTLRASHPGYMPLSIADVAVQGALTTTIDFSLEAHEPISSTDFIFQPQPAQVGEPVIFTGTVSGGSPPIAYAWDFGDGKQGTGQVVEHIFGLEEIYTVVMTATNGAGSITAAHDIEVEGSCIPIEGLAFTFLPTEPMVNDVVYFTASVSTGTHPIFYDWNFGDGTISNGAVVTHTFPSNLSLQSYNITLTGDSLCSSPQSVNKMVVLQPYQAFFPFLAKDR
jgi:PKD repeat protein